MFLVPSESVGGNVETVVGIGLADFLRGAGEFAHNPLVDEGESHRLGGRFADAAVLPFNIHENEARGVPELRAEVAVAFGAFEIKVHVAPERCVGGHREAERIGAVSGNAFRIVLAELLLHNRSLFGLTQDRKSTRLNPVTQ